jgi:copper homeostasis protein
MNIKLEICCDSVESAIIAATAGADRIELCSDLIEGGITPGYGTISSARENLVINLNVIIRPRGGDFLYSDTEFETMKRDIENCYRLGVNEIVTGILLRDGSVDVERTSQLVKIALPMGVTFHRAFDMCNDPFKGLEDVITTGAGRLLTSGQKNSAAEGAVVIKKLVKQSNNRIIVMAGGGIDHENVENLIRTTNVREIHMTGRKVVQSNMTYIKNGISMGGIRDIPEFSRKVADTEEIKEILKILERI